MTGVISSIFFLPVSTLTLPLTQLPLLGIVPVIGIFLMIAGAAWALININSLPMVVDMTDAARLGTYTGLYYLFSTLAAIAGPNVNGWIIQLTGRDYNSTMMIAPIFMVIALFLMVGVRRGEASQASESEPRLSKSGALPG
jgi:MFS-type transporter involved in bile tolerance (Atg22 family)